MNTAQLLIEITKDQDPASITWGLVACGLGATMEQGGAVWRFVDGSAVVYVGNGVCEYLGGGEG